MWRCEEKGYVKIQHAVQLLGEVNTLTYEEKCSTLMGLRLGLGHTNFFVR